MKILMIAPTPFFADRGCHTQIYEEIKALQKLGHIIKLCTYGLGRDVNGVDTVRTLNFPWYNKLSAGPSYTKIFLLPILTFTVLKTMLTFKPDIIHAHLHEGALIARICRLFYRKKRYLFDMQGSLSGETLQHGFIRKGGFFHKLIIWLEKKIANWQFTITQSDSMIGELKSFGVSESRCRNVKDGVDTEIFKPTPFDHALAQKLGVHLEENRVLYMGLLESYQGVDVMFQAFRKVLSKLPGTQFIIIGFPNVDKYTKLCETIGMLGNVVFLGRINYLELPAYLSLAELCIAPKIAQTEGDGKIYNYMAMGLPTVAFDRSVSREILGDTGIFATLNSSEDLAEKIIFALENKSYSNELGEKARIRAILNLSWDAVGKRIDDVYKIL